MPTFLTLPPEIRNAIYADVFVLPVNDPIPTVPSIESPLAKGLQLDPRQHPPQSSPTTTTASQPTHNDLQSSDATTSECYFHEHTTWSAKASAATATATTVFRFTAASGYATKYVAK